MVDVAEVVVKATPKGMDETQDGLDNLESKTQETTDDLDDTAGVMGDLSEKFGGAMGAIIGGLAVAVGGLLSQVPVMREFADGLGAVIDSIAFKIDGVLRPAVSDMTDELFDLAGDIDESDTIAEAFLDTLETLTTIEEIIITATVDFIVETDPADIVGLDDVSKGIALYLDRQLTNVDVPIDTMALLIEIWIRQSIINPIQNFNFSKTVTGLVDRLVGGIETRIAEINNPLQGWIKDTKSIFNVGEDWGEGLIGNIIEGIRKKIGELKGMLSDVQLAPGLTIGDVSSVVDLGTAVAQKGTSSDEGFIGSVGARASKVYLDGQRVSENQGRYSKDRLNRRGG